MPKPEIQILVCTNEREPGDRKPSCGPRGAMDVYHRFKDRVKELGVRDRVMVVRTGCLKHCSRGIASWPAKLPPSGWPCPISPGSSRGPRGTEPPTPLQTGAEGGRPPRLP